VNEKHKALRAAERPPAGNEVKMERMTVHLNDRKRERHANGKWRHRCSECHMMFFARRNDALTCSNACRQLRYRNHLWWGESRRPPGWDPQKPAIKRFHDFLNYV